MSIVWRNTLSQVMMMNVLEEEDPEWNLDNAYLSARVKNYFDHYPTDRDPFAVTFGNSGYKMYTLGLQHGKIYEWTLDEPYAVNTATLANSFAYVSAFGGGTTGRDIYINSNGSKMYLLSDYTSSTVNDTIFVLDLQTNYDISSAQYNNVSVTISGFASSGLYGGPDFSASGDKMYICGNYFNGTNNATAFVQYSLGTNFDPTTINSTYVYYPPAFLSGPQNISFNSNGLRAYFFNSGYTRIERLSLTAAYDLSTASYNSAIQMNGPVDTGSDVTVSHDGKKLILCNNSTEHIQAYNLSTAFDVNTISFEYPHVEYADTSANTSQPSGVFFKPDGLRMFIIDYGNDKVLEYHLTTAWDVATAYYVRDFYVGGQNSDPHDLYIKDDGSKLFVFGRSGSKMYEYTLNNAWEVSSVTYVQASVALNSINYGIQGMWIREDTTTDSGKTLYLCGFNGYVNAIPMTTAWDISTLDTNNVDNFYHALVDSGPRAMMIGDGGYKMVTIGGYLENVNVFKLSTAWDITSATFDTKFDVGGLDGNPHGLFVKPEGDQFFVTGTGSPGGVVSYRIRKPQAFKDISTATYIRENTSGYYGFGNPGACFLKYDGSVIYTATAYSTTSITLRQRPLSRPWDISSFGTATNFSIPIQPGESNVSLRDTFISYDGYHLVYIEHYSGSVVSHTMSTAWDITTASSSYTTYGYNATYGSFQGIHFSPDGLQMFVSSSHRKIHRFSLSTAWDVSTATHVSGSGIMGSASTFNVKGLHMTHDGTRLFILDDHANALVQYNISTPWDTSALSGIGGSSSLPIGSYDNQPRQVFVNDSGTNVYWSGDQYGTLFQFAL